MAKPAEAARRLKKRAEYVRKNAQKLQRKVTLKVQEVLVYATPVDTSRALSNWQASKNTPIRSYIDPYFPGKGGNTQRRSARAAINQGKAAMEGLLPRSCYIVNNAPYIGRLNEGSSLQAPAGFIKVCHQIAAQIIYGTKLAQQENKDD